MNLRTSVRHACLVLLGLAVSTAAQQQEVDPDFKVIVEKPAYDRNGPAVAFDEAHGNTHTAGGLYKPFADLLKSDGYRVTASSRRFEKDALTGIDVLVVANANAHNFTDPAFTEAECDVIRDWVRDGGSLLLIADHEPFGSSASNLTARLGVTMGKGRVFEPVPGSVTTQLVFSRESGTLGTHATLRGRDASEEVKTVRTFTGQSLSVPAGAAALLIFSAAAREAPTTDDLDAEAAARTKPAGKGVPAAGHSTSVSGRAQGIAMTFGKGKVVVLGEAAVFSAQVIRFADGQRVMKIGMNVPGSDDRQFALNVAHWLSGLLK